MANDSVALQKEYGMFIGGQFVPSVSGKVFSTINPATGEKLADVASGCAEDVDQAVAAAWEAFPAWAGLDPKERAQILFAAADRLEENTGLLATVETLDNGKPLIESEFDIADIVDQFRYFASCLRADEGKCVYYGQNAFSILQKEPFGVVGQIIPWNFPLSIAGWKLAPALAAGNCCVIKPASLTSLSILELAKLLQDILPAGVLNIVTGSGSVVGSAISKHPRIRKLSFTGSTAVGKEIGMAAGNSIIPSTLELGGKSANIVFADAQFERALIGVCAGILYNQGQVCSAGSRAFVQEDIYDRFVAGLIEKFSKVKVGNGLAEDTVMGPIVSAQQLKTNLDYIEVGKQEGARLAFGGNRLIGGEFEKGFYLEPTLFVDATNAMRIAQEEIFGPVLTVIKFKTEAEVVALANDSRYGLAGGVWSQDINKAIRVARGVQTGTMYVNEYGPIPGGSAFGGYKDSGFGREVCKETLDAYRQTKNIYVCLNETVDPIY